jgi:hypothetical protein
MDYSLHIDKKYLEDLILKLKDGQVVENNKIDLKRQWYKLDNEEEQNEFAKDICAIANTVGLEGCLIIGITASGETFDSPVMSSGINDVNNIYQILVKHTNPAPSIDIDVIKIGECNISVVKIPPSLDKPHFVKKHKTRLNAIFVRSGTSTQLANRSDIDLMYYDRKNIEPEYNATVELFSNKNIDFYEKSADAVSTHSLILNIEVLIQNIGRRPIFLKECDIFFDNHDKGDILSHLSFNLKQYHLDNADFICKGKEIFPPILIKANEADFIRFVFEVKTSKIWTVNSMHYYLERGGFMVHAVLSTVRNERFESNEFYFSNP